MKDVLIDIKGTQGIGDDADVIEFTTVGQMACKNGKYYLFYNENDTLGADDIKTTLKAEGDDKITLSRTGRLESRLVIEKGQRSKCFYSTIQGQLVLGIFGESIVNTLKDDGGTLSMAYTIDVDNSLLSRNTVEIKVREVNK
ncbi:MAG: DUF1934 domain-containing protein [Ruminococcaceae bacterium]|nr:DUF1934 domain-containing protein [Oscillospiraceae bacterium]